jgi:ATP-dependent RNA helicase RhlE
MTFEELGVDKHIVKALKDYGMEKPYPIQESAIPEILKGKDLLGIAKTGSGKTASFVVPSLMQLDAITTTKSREPNVLVLVPTRELAEQIKNVYLKLSHLLPYRVKTMAVYGGVSINPQMKGLQHVNILVATPGRLLDLVSSNALSLSNISTLILDEADKMLNLGFKEEMTEIFKLLPMKRQNLLFSATLSRNVEAIKDILLKDPVVVEIKEKETDITQIEQLAYFVNQEEKGPLLRRLIEESDWNQVLVFTSSIYQADHVSDKLKKNGITARAIHSKKGQKNRQDALQQFKAGTLKVLVATDLLSRGIDVQSLSCVINYELPRSPKDYIHRIGRTGRAEEVGEALTFVAPDDEHHFKIIQKKNKIVIPVHLEN